ncbi:unnamed protein product [Didymodactylos carnosus]|uniref:Uncharacterized protein n=1 Tax=Didymodactylos carnosus TaxID=1234261 RepID=A0A814BYG7_9BILA|nr:unnamed protein product [Didymodactylos carnosus]CAF0934429.1 unnamed protein product [Didymodactylos carnosus]CAF3679821.1 unnamed protein product [Didymodactylos carnosus]CAF3711895.1 unnamed protein product [Didymodactylos carnosus]
MVLYAIYDVISVWFIMLQKEMYASNKNIGTKLSTAELDPLPSDSLLTITTATRTSSPLEEHQDRTVTLGLVISTPEIE